MRYEHIIWDWNGTLMNDAWLCVEVVNGLLERRGLETISVDRYREIFDFPVINYYHRLGFDKDRDTFHNVSVDFIGTYDNRRLECELQEGARQLLQDIAHANIPQSILSAYRQETLEELVEHYQLKEFFHMITGHQDIYAEGKVENARQKIKKLDVDPKRVLLIGDTQHDHEVAQAIGCDCLLVSHGHHSQERLERLGVPVAHCISDLREVIFRE